MATAHRTADASMPFKVLANWLLTNSFPLTATGEVRMDLPDARFTGGDPR